MNDARQWLARTETELLALDKDAKALLKITKGMIDKEKGKTPPKTEGSVTPQEREDILRLKGQGWKTEEIAESLHRSRGEIELVLELASRGV